MGAASDLRTYLVTQQGYANAPVRVGGLPETPDACVALVPFGSAPPVLAMGEHNVVERVTYVQVLVRGARDGYEAAEAEAETVWQLCRHALSVTVGANVYDRIVVSGEPVSLPPDRNERALFSFTVETWKRGS